VEGIILAQHKPARLVVSVTLLQRSVAVEIDESWARPIDRAPGLRPAIDPQRMLVAGRHGDEAARAKAERQAASRGRHRSPFGDAV